MTKGPGCWGQGCVVPRPGGLEAWALVQELQKRPVTKNKVMENTERDLFLEQRWDVHAQTLRSIHPAQTCTNCTCMRSGLQTERILTDDL